MEWLDELSLWWYVTGIVFIIGALFIVKAFQLFFEFYRVSIGEEDELEQRTHKSMHKQPPN